MKSSDNKTCANSEQELKRLLGYINKRSVEIMDVKGKFDTLIINKYGIHYSDVDEDEIIDCVDMGLGKMSFELFNKLMKLRMEKNK